MASAAPFKFSFFSEAEADTTDSAIITDTTTVNDADQQTTTSQPTIQVEPCRLLEIPSTSVHIPEQNQLIRVHQLFDLRIISGAQVQPQVAGSLGKVVERTDVQPGVYEGGFKLWECAIDLMNYVTANPTLLSQQSQQQTNAITRVLELGCGHGVPGIQCLRLSPNAHVTFQDLNAEVLEQTTACNVLANGGVSALERCAFVAGDWARVSDVLAHHSFDLILMSETVYSEANYAVLHNVLEHALSEYGCALVAGKRYYFGVGGGIDSFAEFVKKVGVFECTHVETMDDGGSNLRDTVKLVRKVV